MKNSFLIVLGMLLISALYGCDKQAETKTVEKEAYSLEKLFELKEKCAKDGKEFYKNYRISNYDKDNLWDDPEFHFSKKLNTCLIHVRYLVRMPKYNIEPPDTIHYNEVIDIFSNKVLMYGNFTRSGDKDHHETLNTTMNDDVPNYASNEYFKHKDSMFNE